MSLIQRVGPWLSEIFVVFCVIANDEVRLVVFLSDEIFAKNIPILVTVDPISSAILRIELAQSRKIEDWKKHWECIQENGHIAIYLVIHQNTGSKFRRDNNA